MPIEIVLQSFHTVKTLFLVTFSYSSHRRRTSGTVVLKTMMRWRLWQKSWTTSHFMTYMGHSRSSWSTLTGALKSEDPTLKEIRVLYYFEIYSCLPWKCLKTSGMGLVSWCHKHRSSWNKWQTSFLPAVSLVGLREADDIMGDCVCRSERFKCVGNSWYHLYSECWKSLHRVRKGLDSPEC